MTLRCVLNYGDNMEMELQCFTHAQGVLVTQHHYTDSGYQRVPVHDKHMDARFLNMADELVYMNNAAR